MVEKWDFTSESNSRKWISRPQASLFGREGERRNSNYEINHNRLSTINIGSRIRRLNNNNFWCDAVGTGNSFISNTDAPFHSQLFGGRFKSRILMYNSFHVWILKNYSSKKKQIANETEKSLIFARFLWLWFDTSPCTLRVTNIDPATVFIEIVNKSQNMSTNTNTNKTNGNIRLNGKLEQNNRQVRFVYFVPFISYPHVIKSMEPSIQRDDIAFRALAQKSNTRFMVWFCVCFCVFFGFQA